MTTIREARPGEGVVVARLIRESLSPSLEGLTIWHCNGVDHWVEVHLATPGSAAFYLAVDESDQAIAAAEFRIANGSVFLNQIGVTSSQQGKGIGGRLFAAGLCEASQRKGVASLSLDVETANERADAWYRRLGLSPVSRTHWSLTTLQPAGAAPARVEGWDDAERDHARFGFSQFQVNGNVGPVTVGRLGDSLFRLTSEEAWRDPTVRAALGWIDANRRLLLINESPIGARRTTAAQPVRQTERLTGSIKPVLGKLPTP